MKKNYFKISCGTDYCGTEMVIYVCFVGDWTEKDIEKYAQSMMEYNGEAYQYLAECEADKEEYEDDGDYEEALDWVLDTYWEDCWYETEQVSEEEWKANNGTIEEK